MARPKSGEKYIGKKFRFLTVTSIERSHGNVVCVCKCSCGSSTRVRATKLLNKYQVDCGCKSSKKNVCKVGTCVGGLKVLEHKVVKSRLFCKVQCDCGKVRFVDNYWLRTTKPLGCKQCVSDRRSNLTRPPQGSRFGNRIVINNNLWTNPKIGRRKAACLVECDCGTRQICSVNSLKSGKNKCNKCRVKTAGDSLRLEAHKIKAQYLELGKTLIGTRRVVEWALWASMPTGSGKYHTHPEWSKIRRRPLVDGFNRYHYNLLLPTNTKHKPVWPWNDEGKTIPNLKPKRK